MNRTIMFAAASLILVAAIVTVTMSNAVSANPPKTIIQYCAKGHVGDPAYCYPTRQECTDRFVPIGEPKQCVRVASK